MSHEVDFEVIGSRVMYELNRRLATPALAQDLPGTLLMKVAMDYVKHLERKNEIEEAKLNQEKVNPLEMIDQPGVPLTVRIEVLREWIDDLEENWRAASERLVELQGGEHGDESEVLHEVQDVVPEG